MISNFTVGDSGLAVDLQVITGFNPETGAPIADPIDTATTKEFVFVKPDRRTTVTKTVNFITDGTDGWLRYLLEASLFDEPGQWEVYYHVVEPSRDFHGHKVTFGVNPGP